MALILPNMPNVSLTGVNKQLISTVSGYAMQAIPALRSSPIRAAFGFITSWLPINFFNTTFIAGVAVSVISRDRYKYRARLTGLTVEDGSVIADHVILDPDEIEQEFEICNTYGETMARNAAEDLRNVMKSRLPVTVITTHGQYDDMFLEDIDIDHSLEYKHRLVCKAKFKKINWSKTETTTSTSISKKFTKNQFSQSNREIKNKVSPEINRGTQTAKESSFAYSRMVAQKKLGAK